jgi:mRNA interferase MazF
MKNSYLPKESVVVVNVSQLITIDKSLLTERVTALSEKLINQIEDGLKLILALR